jgi:hypothetical protein
MGLGIIEQPPLGFIDRQVFGGHLEMTASNVDHNLGVFKTF